MKRVICVLSFLAMLCLLACCVLRAQVILPNVSQSADNVTGTGLRTDIVNTRTQSIAWRLTWWYTGFSAVTAEIDCAPDNGSGGAGSYAACAGAFDGTTNPQAISSTPQAGTISVKTFSPHVAVNFTVATGTGVIHYLMVGYVGTNVSPSVVSSAPMGTTAVNLAQVAGTNTVTGGVAGSLGVGGLAAAGAAAAGDPNLVGGVDLAGNVRVPTIDAQGNGFNFLGCDSQVRTALSGTGFTQIVAGSGSTVIRVCKLFVTSAAAGVPTVNTFVIAFGTCAGTPTQVQTAAGITGLDSDYGGALKGAAGAALCVSESVAQSDPVTVVYSQH